MRLRNVSERKVCAIGSANGPDPINWPISASACTAPPAHSVLLRITEGINEADPASG